jgi:hypothetical protein
MVKVGGYPSPGKLVLGRCGTEFGALVRLAGPVDSAEEAAQVPGQRDDTDA